MELINLNQSIEDSKRELHGIKNELRELGKRKAQSEHDYKLAKRKKHLELKSQKYTGTDINNIIDGEPGVAELRLERDLAVELVKATHDIVMIELGIMNASQSQLKYQTEA